MYMYMQTSSVYTGRVGLVTHRKQCSGQGQGPGGGSIVKTQVSQFAFQSFPSKKPAQSVQPIQLLLSLSAKLGCRSVKTYASDGSDSSSHCKARITLDMFWSREDRERSSTRRKCPGGGGVFSWRGEERERELDCG